MSPASIRRQLASPAMLVAILALVISLGGTAWAAATITGANIKDGTLTGIDVKNNTLTGVDVKTGTLAEADLSTSARGSLKGQKGDTGAAGANGTNGTNGTNGGAGVTGAAGSARAVAVLSGTPGPTCTVSTALSRGVATTCTRNASLAGNYYIDLAAGVSSANTYPICSFGNNLGANVTLTSSCVAQMVDADTMAVWIYIDNVTDPSPLEHADAGSAVPIVVVLP